MKVSHLSAALLASCLALSSLPTFAGAPAETYDFQTVPWGGGGYVPGFLYHPKVPGILYARTDVGGMYRYDYKSQKWLPLLDHLSRADRDLMGVLSLAIDPNDANKIYAAAGLYVSQWARKGAILRSSDRGKTWQKFDLPIGVGGNADGRGTGERLIVDPANGNTIFFGSNQDGLWKSTDGGASFAQAGTPAKSISLMFFDSNHVLYLGSADSMGALMASNDGGQNFSVVPSTPAMIPQRMAEAKDGSLYVTFAKGDKEGAVNPSGQTSGGVWKRDPDGTWHEITPLKPGPDAKFGYSGIDVGPDGMVVTSDINRWWPGSDIYASRDGGKTWIEMHGKVTKNKNVYPWTKGYGDPEPYMGGWNSDLKINPFNKNEMVYQEQGVWVATNLSDIGTGKPVNFAYADDGFEETAILDLAAPPKGAIVMAAIGDNAGGAWFELTQSPDEGLFHPTTHSNQSVDYAGLKPLYIVRTNEDEEHPALVSTDGGLSWQDLPSSIFDKTVDIKKAGWPFNRRIAVSAGATSLVWGPNRGPVCFSKDGGKSWAISAGLPESKDTALVPTADKQLDEVFYVYDPSGKIFISVDGGASFKPSVTGLPALSPWQRGSLAVAPAPAQVRDLWLAMPDALVHSPDPNRPAKPIPGVTAAYAIGFGASSAPGAYPTIYLSGKVMGVVGFWKSADVGKTWTEITNRGQRLELVDIIAGDLRESGVVYTNSPHGGLMVGRLVANPRN